jgi:transcriptional regulator with GAF, ATPase, and Fis domain
MTDTSTETALGASAAPHTRRVPYLFVAIEASRPLAGGARLALDDLDDIAIGRGDTRAVTRTGRSATLTIPDRRMSAQHARILRALDGWELIDAGAKNGCRIAGATVTRAPIPPAAWIELGQTLLRLRDEPADGELWRDAETAEPTAGVITLLPRFAAQLGELARLAQSRVSLVIAGATGTGKEVVARAVHGLSGRRGAFVAINCAALPDGLVESQLFGHKKGAFSGATADHPGLVRAADGGTLLLDEIGDMPLAAQAALLRVLQEREVVAVGDTRPAAVVDRVIAASHRDLGERVRTGALRADLYARLAGHAIELPPLAARREDIGTAIATALARHGAREAKLEIAAAAALVDAAWPGNLRELDKAIETALALAGDAPLSVDHFPTGDPGGDSQLRAQLTALLVEHRGNITQIARAMGKARMQVQRWLARFGLDAERYRGA